MSMSVPHHEEESRAKPEQRGRPQCLFAGSTTKNLRSTVRPMWFAQTFWDLRYYCRRFVLFWDLGFGIWELLYRRFEVIPFPKKRVGKDTANYPPGSKHFS
jgi:hypothetical protein